MPKLILSTMIHPKKEIIAVCGVCQKEVKRIAYEGYQDHVRVRSRLLKTESCPHCAAVFIERKCQPTIKWEKTAKGDYIAKCKNGDFLVFKWGNVWKWRYRPYGQTQPDVVRTAKTKDLAKRACEHHEEFRQ